VVFAIDRAGIVGEDGATHNGIFDLAYLRCVPNMVIAAPADENELQQMLYASMNHEGPIAIRYPRGCGPGVELDEDPKTLEIGKGEIVYKSTEHRTPNTEHGVLIVAIGSMVHPSIEVAKMLEEKGVEATVINARFVKPLDEKLIRENAKLADLIVTIEEGTLSGGFGSAVVELLAENNIKLPVLRLGLPDRFIEHGKREEILKLYGLTAEGIYEKVLRAIKY
jgi:1-deoxy-D-xylulose-5-phosphate synthase